MFFSDDGSDEKAGDYEKYVDPDVSTPEARDTKVENDDREYSYCPETIDVSAIVQG